MFVILDTNIYVSDFRLRSPSFETLISGCARVGHRLLIPQLVLDELLNKYAEEYQKFLDAQRRLGVGPEGPIRTKKPRSIEEAKKLYQDYFITRLPSGYQLRYPNTPHEALVKRALRRAKPFRNTDTGGYRDAILWYTILDAARHFPLPIAFITANLRDFSNPNDPSQLHPDLVRDLINQVQHTATVELFPSLDEFLHMHIIPTLTTLDDIRAHLVAGTYKALDLQSFTTNELATLLSWKEFAPNEVGFPSEYETSHLSTIKEVETIVEIDVHQLNPDELLISYTAVALCDFDVFIFRSDYYSLPDDEVPFVWGRDWSKHYMAASDTSTVKLRIALVFSTRTKTVQSAQISTAEPAEEW